MMRASEQMLMGALSGKGYERLVIQKNGGCGRPRFRKKLEDNLTVDLVLEEGGSDLYRVEYSKVNPLPGGKHIKISNFHTVSADTILKKIDEYENLIKDMSKNNNGGNH